MDKKLELLNRMEKQFKDNPQSGLLRPLVRATASDTKVKIKAGKFEWAEDLPVGLGGSDTQPGPLHHLLGSLAGCGAGLVKSLLAPLMGVSVDSVDVDVQCDFNLRDCYGLAGKPASIENVTFTMTVHSKDDEAKIEKMFETWKERAPVYVAFQTPVKVSTNLVVKRE